MGLGLPSESFLAGPPGRGRRERADSTSGIWREPVVATVIVETDPRGRQALADELGAQVRSSLGRVSAIQQVIMAVQQA